MKTTVVRVPDEILPLVQEMIRVHRANKMAKELREMLDKMSPSAKAKVSGFVEKIDEALQ